MPNIVNIYGENMSTGFGNPVVLVYDSTGAVVGSATASFVSGDGTSIQVPADLINSAVYSGTYTLSVNNVTADGSLDQVGIAYIALTGLPDPPPPPPPPQPPVDPCPTNPCLPQD
jgi:hypothetical protein